MEQQGREVTKPVTPEQMLGEAPVIHPGAQVSECRLGAWTEIGPGWTLIETDFGDYSYAAGSDGVIQYARVGTFCSIASHVVINPGDHPMSRVTQHHLTYRRRRYGLGVEDGVLLLAARKAV